MRHGNWFIATAAGASLSLLTAGGLAQVRTDTKGGVELPETSDASEDAPPAKGPAVERDAATARPTVPVRAAAAEERRETRRLPIIDANATFRSTQLIGTNITDADGRAIGKVVDFVSDARGNILYPIVSYSGSPGFTGKLFAVPFAGLRFSAGGNNGPTAQFAFDPQLLNKAPSFSSARFPDFTDAALLNDLKSFYSNLLPITNSRPIATDQANSPTQPVDPTLPANGPGDRPAVVNPALPPSGKLPGGILSGSGVPGASGPAVAGTDRSGTITSARAGASAKTGSSIVGKTGSSASDSIPGSAAAELEAGAEGNASVGGNNQMMLRSSQMVGMSIQDKSGKAIGKVVDFVGDASGNRRFAVVSLGGDNRNIVLPDSALNFQAGAKGASFATLRVSPGQLKNAPSFSGNEWPDFSSREFQSNFQKFYQRLIPGFNSMSTTSTGATSPGGSTSTPGGTRTPDFPSRPIPPGGPVPRPGPDGNFPTTTPPTTSTGTTPGGSRSTPGGTRTPDFPSRPIPPGGPVPRPGPGGNFPATPSPPIPPAATPGVGGVPAPGGPPARAGGAPSGGSGGARGGAGASGT